MNQRDPEKPVDKGRKRSDGKGSAWHRDCHWAMEIQACINGVVRRLAASKRPFLESLRPERFQETDIRETIESAIRGAIEQHFADTRYPDGLLERAHAAIPEAVKQVPTADFASEELSSLLCGQFTLADDDRTTVRTTFLRMIEPVNNFVLAYLPLVCRIVRGHRVPPNHREDCIQEGAMAIRTSALTFLPYRGHFARYAMTRIQGAVLDTLRRASGTTSHGAKLAAKCRRARKRLIQDLQREPNEFEVFDNLNFNASQRKTAAQALIIQGTRPYGCTDDEGIALILSGDCPDPASVAADNEEMRRLNAAIEQLPPMEHRVIVSCYFARKTLKGTAEELQIPYHHVRKLHTTALENLERAMGTDNVR
jgi:RNA polymerase sigma factor FliA